MVDIKRISEYLPTTIDIAIVGKKRFLKSWKKRLNEVEHDIVKAKKKISTIKRKHPIIASGLVESEPLRLLEVELKELENNRDYAKSVIKKGIRLANIKKRLKKVV